MSRGVRPGRWSLTARVAGTVLVLLVVLLGFVVATYRQAADERREAELRNAVEVAQALATSVDAFARDLESTTLAVALALGVRDGPFDQRTTGPYLRALSDDYGVLRGLFVTDAGGRVVASASGTGIGLDLSPRPYMRSLREGSPVVWGPGVRGIESGDITVTFGRGVRGPDAVVRGYLVAAFYPPLLVDRLRLDVAPDLDVSLLDAQGLVLHSTSRPDLPFERRDASAGPRVQAALRGEVVRVDEATVLFGNEARYGALVPVPRTGWVVAATRPLAPLDAELRSRFLQQVAGITAAVLLVAVALIVTARQLARPLRELSRTADAIARGERPEVPSAGDPDVARLAVAMQAMATAIAEREQAASRHAARLAVLAEASRAFAEAGAEPQETLDAIAEQVARLVGDGCLVFLVSDDGQLLTPVAVAHPVAEARDLAQNALARGPIRVGEGLVGPVVRTGAPLLLPVVPQEQVRSMVSPSFLPYLDRFAIHSFAAVPLRARDHLIGVMAAWRGEPGHPYVEEDVLVLTDLADRAGLAIERARLYRETRDRAAAEAELNAALQEAIRVRDEFLATVSHDLNNPLTIVKATAQLLRRQTERGTVDPARQIESLTTIETAAERAADQIDELLDVAQLQIGQPLGLRRRRVELVALLRRAVAAQQRTTDRHTIRLEVEAEALVGDWDPARVERVIENLLGNAVKYSPAGGEIVVRVDRERDEAGEWAVVAVRDVGIGIPAASLSRIFERFHRAANVVGRIAGTGIGLSGVKQIVEQHGGEVAVASEEGVGSTFTVRLPLADGDVREASAP